MQNTKIQIQIKDINISFEGSEEFVKGQLNDLKQTLGFLGLIKESERGNLGKSNSAPAQKEIDGIKNISNLCEKYPTIFSEVDGEIKVIYQKLGDTERNKTQNLVLLYCFANENNFPEQKIPYQKLNDQKKDQGIVDKGKNFSSYVKSLRGDIILTGKNSSATVKLTLPGREKAQKFCDDVLKEYESKS